MSLGLVLATAALGVPTMSSAQDASTTTTTSTSSTSTSTSTTVAPATASAQASSDAARDGSRDLPLEVRSLDGSANNQRHPSWGAAGQIYLREASTNYADGRSAMVQGPNARYISNRIFNDSGQNVFSMRGATQWVWTWGQFLDHTFGLRQDGGESAPIPFDENDPLEAFQNDLGTIDFARSAAAPGTGTSSRNPRQQVNTVSSFIDAFAVYGGTDDRLEWLRDGPVNGNLDDNAATLMLPGGYLPTATARGNAATAPPMELQGPLQGNPSASIEAGDRRANENIALTATHTLMAREHNRIVGLLPRNLSDQAKFEIARRVVGAEEQYITYNEFLPAVGVQLPAYRGYDPSVNPALSNEFATVGYRVHSMIHGEFEIEVSATRYTADQLAAFESEGIEVEHEGGNVVLVVPLDVAFGNPALVPQIGLGPILAALGGESQYANDEQMDNQLRSTLFELPAPGSDPTLCTGADAPPSCFRGVTDLGALDVQRGRDHGMPTYNDLRRAYGLAPKTSFTSITGESTESFPRDPLINQRDPINDPNILDVLQLFDRNGNSIPLGSEAASDDAVREVRRTTLAARLKGVFGSVNRLDAFTGMLSEKHLPGSELGELQNAIWTDQFTRLRDGDRFFYLNDPALRAIRQLFGIDYRTTLAELIQRNSDATGLAANVFLLRGVAH
ncbi:MAG TPA: peroxidase family protein [Acidimicrobiales bacterium]|nr:peroxidase family protein [Acidimicrobiales bacterium]